MNTVINAEPTTTTTMVPEINALGRRIVVTNQRRTSDGMIGIRGPVPSRILQGQLSSVSSVLPAEYFINIRDPIL